MFKIVNYTKALTKFFLIFQLNLSRPQKRHVKNFIETIIACEGRKTIARLNHLLYDPRDQSAFTDFFTYSPWDTDSFRYQVYQGTMKLLVDEQPQLSLFEEPLFIIFDDSKTVKPGTSRHFEVTDWQFNSSELRGYYYGLPFVSCHLMRGAFSIPLAIRPYLRQRTVRRHNRKRKNKGINKRIPFKSKYTIVKEILTALVEFLPDTVPVYVLFDSWYASAKLIKLCRRKRWHVICALKSNRKLKKIGAPQSRQLAKIARRIRKKDFQKTIVKSSDSSHCYWVHTLKGRLNKINDDVSIFISKRHYNDKRPEFFLCTDLSLNPQSGLSFYSKRWAVEVDHLYLKIRLGLGDYRLRSYEGVCRYFDLVCLTLAFLYWRLTLEKGSAVKSLSDVIELHRRDQQIAFFEKFADHVKKYKNVQDVINKWFPKAA